MGELPRCWPLWKLILGGCLAREMNLWLTSARVAWLAMLLLTACSSEDPGATLSVGSTPDAPALSVEPPECAHDADCNGAAPGACTVGRCEAGACVAEPAADGLACDDLNACTEGDACEAGACSPGANVCLCAIDVDCDQYDDGDECSGTLICVNGGCVVEAGTAVSCPPSLGCIASQCNPLTGTCEITSLPDGAACDDANACTLGETCVQGSCGDGAPVQCEPNGPCQTVGCDPSVGCVGTPLPDGNLCSDGNPCTDGDGCQGGACVSGPNTCACAVDDDCAPFQLDKCAAPLVCVADLCESSAGPGVLCEQPDNPCYVATCQSGTGECVAAALADGDSCETAVACSAGASCEGTVCVPLAGSCDDGNPCTVGTCDVLGGCAQSPTEGPCDDGDPCTSDAVCMDGACTGQTLLCECQDDQGCAGGAFDPCLGLWTCASGYCELEPDTAITCDSVSPPPCAIAVCEAGSGTCALVAQQDGAPCDDGNPCTKGAVCEAGVCAGGVPEPCQDDNPCTNDSCAPGVGCKHAFNAAPCDDGNACTQSDTCIDGACFGGAAVKCTSSSPCQVPACDAAVGCYTLAADDGGACDDGSACTADDACLAGACTGASQCDCLGDADCPDDGDPCTGVDACVDGLCVPAPGSAPVCEPSSDCVSSVCEPATGACVQQAMEDGAACAQVAPCKLGPGQCLAGACVGVDIVCDDGLVCTTDTCDPQTGLCESTPVADMVTCADGDPCSTADACVGGFCVGTGPPLACDDEDTCTVDVCVPGEGCSFTPDGCDDADPCTVDVCKADEGCAHVPLPCPEPTGPCEVVVCDPAAGACEVAAAPDGAPCGDVGGDPCVVSACAGGVCVSSTTSCDDGDPCTEDACEADGSCVVTPLPVGSACDDGLDCTLEDVCDVQGACAGAPDCDDGDPCTDDACDAEGCVSAPVDCADDDPCTLDTCGAGGQCKSQSISGCTDPVVCDGPAGSACDDGEPATVADMCLLDICRGFELGGVAGSDIIGHVVYQRVQLTQGVWYAALLGLEGPLGDGGALASLDGSGAPVPAAETVSTATYPALGDGFAADSDGGLWILGASGVWAPTGTLQDAFALVGDIEPLALWSTSDSGTASFRLWAVGSTPGGGPMVIRCTSDPGAALYGCAEESLPTTSAGLVPRAVTGARVCSGSDCQASRVIIGSTDGDMANGTWELPTPQAPGALWEKGVAGEPGGASTTRDGVALGSGRYLLVGTHGYLRHRSPDGTWSAPLAPFADQGERHFEAAWAGAGVVIVAAWRALAGAQRALELWVLPLDGANPASPAGWVVYAVGQFPGELTGLYGVDGRNTGAIRAVGSTEGPSGYAGGLVLKREPK